MVNNCPPWNDWLGYTITQPSSIHYIGMQGRLHIFIYTRGWSLEVFEVYLFFLNFTAFSQSFFLVQPYFFTISNYVNPFSMFSLIPPPPTPLSSCLLTLFLPSFPILSSASPPPLSLTPLPRDTSKSSQHPFPHILSIKAKT